MPSSLVPTESLQSIIAWLVPTARGSLADKAAHMPENALRSLAVASSTHLTSHMPEPVTNRPQRAISLAFDQGPRRPASFVLGTDPTTCDVVLPPSPALSPQHCALRFDLQSRLVLDDFSEMGTQVWYGGRCSGDQKDYRWTLSSSPCLDFRASTPQRIVLDIQGVRFRVVLNGHSSNWARFEHSVEGFRRGSTFQVNPAGGFLAQSWPSVAPLMAAVPLFQQIFIGALDKDHSFGGVYLWDLTRPWEPLVKATA